MPCRYESAKQDETKFKQQVEAAWRACDRHKEEEDALKKEISDLKETIDNLRHEIKRYAELEKSHIIWNENNMSRIETH